LRKEIETSGGQAYVASADVASRDGATELAEQVRKIAGITEKARNLDSSRSAFTQTTKSAFKLPPNAKRQTPNAKRRTPNAERRTPNAKRLPNSLAGNHVK
jgi:hypothetical protein